MATQPVSPVADANAAAPVTAANNRDDFDEPKHPDGIDGSQVGLTAGTLYVDYPCKYCSDSIIFVRLNPPGSGTHAKEKGGKFSQHCSGSRHKQAKAASLAGTTDAPATSSQPRTQVIRPERFHPGRSPPAQWTPLNVTTYLEKNDGGELTLLRIEEFAVEYLHPQTKQIRYAVQAAQHPERGEFNAHYSGPGATLKNTLKCVFSHDVPIAVWLDHEVVADHYGEHLRTYESTLWSYERAWQIEFWEPREVLRVIYLEWHQLREPRLARHLLSVDAEEPQGGASPFEYNDMLSVEQQRRHYFVFADDPQRPNRTRGVWLPEECKFIFGYWTGGSLPYAKKSSSMRDAILKRRRDT